MEPTYEDRLNKAIDINDLHMILGHPSQNITRNTARKNQIQVIGTMKECHECALVKIKQHKIAKETTHRSNVPGERLCIDISSVRSPSYGGAKFWLLIIDDATRTCLEYFSKIQERDKRASNSLC